jgi:hypothetical protein
VIEVVVEAIRASLTFVIFSYSYAAHGRTHRTAAC